MGRLKGPIQHLTKQITLRISPQTEQDYMDVYGKRYQGVTTAVRQWLLLRELEIEYLHELFTEHEISALQLVWSDQTTTVDRAAIAAQVQLKAGDANVSQLLAKVRTLSPVSTYFLTEWCRLSLTIPQP